MLERVPTVCPILATKHTGMPGCILEVPDFGHHAPVFVQTERLHILAKPPPRTFPHVKTPSAYLQKNLNASKPSNSQKVYRRWEQWL